MLDKIVVPLDGSDLAEEVLPVVEELASKLSADVLLLQAVISSSEAIRETVPGSGVTPEIGMDVARQRVEAETESAETYLKTVSERLASQGLTATTAVSEGPPVGAILEYAREKGASLIALATHGRSGLARAVMGSVADAVVRNSEVPVLLVRAKG
jgi:nucleotide-binding universal stress UspA family protein